MQEDRLLPHLTCYETLFYAGMLRLPRSMTKDSKLAHIQRIITELGLKDCSHTRVGTPDGSGQRLSGGERRRLSLAVQILTQPSEFYPHTETCAHRPRHSLSRRTNFGIGLFHGQQAHQNTAFYCS